MKVYEYPIWRKYALTVSEASVYFGIGEKRIRQIIEDNPYEDFILEIGSHVKIKRELFEKYLNSMNSI